MPKDIYCDAEWSLRSGVYSPHCRHCRQTARVCRANCAGTGSGPIRTAYTRKSAASVDGATVGWALAAIDSSAWLRSSGSLPDCSASTRNACSAWACASSLKREGRQNANPVALAGRITTAAPIPTHRRSLHQLEAHQALKVFPGPSALKHCRPHVPLQFRHLASRSSAPTG